MTKFMKFYAVLLIIAAFQLTGFNAYAEKEPAEEPAAAETVTDEEEMCDVVYEEDEDGFLEEAVQNEIMRQEKEGSTRGGPIHMCRVGVTPWPRFNLGANTDGPVKCKKKAAKRSLRKQLADANCVGANDPQCDGICEPGENCERYSKRDGAPVIICRRTPGPVAACNNRKGWVCTARVGAGANGGQYKCSCSCF